MSFLKNLSKLFNSSSADANVYWVTVKCKRCGEIILSPVFGAVDYAELARWILEDALPVRMQLQLHKFIWHPDARGV